MLTLGVQRVFDIWSFRKDIYAFILVVVFWSTILGGYFCHSFWLSSWQIPLWTTAFSSHRNVWLQNHAAAALGQRRGEDPASRRVYFPTRICRIERAERCSKFLLLQLSCHALSLSICKMQMTKAIWTTTLRLFTNPAVVHHDANTLRTLNVWIPGSLSRIRLSLGGKPWFQQTSTSDIQFHAGIGEGWWQVETKSRTEQVKWRQNIVMKIPGVRTIADMP